MAQKFHPENVKIIRDGVGNAIPNARLTFYRARTLEPIPLFLDPSCEVPAANPIFADDRGQVPDIYIADGTSFDVRVHDCTGAMVVTIEQAESSFEGFPHVRDISDIRRYEGPSNFLYMTDECERLALYRRAPNADLTENLPTVVQGVCDIWVGGVIITEFDLASYLEEAFSLASPEEGTD